MATSTIPTADVATPATTLIELTRVSARGYTVVRNIFVQVHVGDNWVGSSLGRLVAGRQPRALLAYLLLLMSWSALDKRPEPLEAAVWARALSPEPPDAPWAPSAMTRVWNTLEDTPHQLITRERVARLVKLAPRKENGKGPYARPRPDQSSSRRELFFILPDAFWLEGWHNKLTLPSIAVLLIVLSGTTGRDEAVLPYDRAQDWYGISPKTMQNGVENLRIHGLLSARHEWVRADLSKIGRSPKISYCLTGAFSRDSRHDLQREAVRATKKRVAKRTKATKQHFIAKTDES
jgi:hypothetical protein